MRRENARWLIAVAASLAAGGLSVSAAVAPAMALADGTGGPKPSVESESASNITATDATLEATINPGSGEDGFALETTYEFFLESPWCGTHGPGFCEGTGGTLVDKGTIAAGATAPQVESVDLASVGEQLSPHTIYGYRVVARNEVGEAFGFEKTFLTPAEGSAPVIESLSIANLTPTDATLEATIDTEGSTTFYEWEMWSSPCSKHGAGCELLMRVALPFGVLDGSFGSQHVSLDLNSGAHVTLGPGEYGVSLKAINEGGAAEAPWQSFEAPLGVIDPPPPTVTPGPVSNEPTVALAGGQNPTSGGNGSPTSTGASVPAGMSSKPAHGKPAAKHGKRHKHKHHPAKGVKHRKPKKHR